MFLETPIYHVGITVGHGICPETSELLRVSTQTGPLPRCHFRIRSPSRKTRLGRFKNIKLPQKRKAAVPSVCVYIHMLCICMAVGELITPKLVKLQKGVHSI